MRSDQGGIQIDDHFPSGRNQRGQLPHRGPRGGPRTTDRGDHRGRLTAQSVDESTDRGIRGHHAEQLRLGPHHRGISEAVTAECDRDGQI